MARYEDYVNRKTDAQVEAELQQAQQQTQARRDIPDSVRKRFDGKTIEDVMESYANLEKEKSRLGNTVNQLRQTNEQLLEIQLTNQPHQATQPNPQQDTSQAVPQITVDDLYDKPGEAIKSVVESTSKPTIDRLETLENQLRQLEREKTKAVLDAKFNDWESDIQSSEFQDFITSSSYRMKLAKAADNYDFDAANDLLESWYDHKNSTQEAERENTRNQQLEAAALESSGPSGIRSEPTFSRQDLQRRRVRAAQGDLEQQEWLRANQSAITLAYAEDRLTN